MDFKSLSLDGKKKFIEKEVNDFKQSERLQEAEKCASYYETNNPDIMSRKKLYASMDEYIEDGSSFIKAVAKENKFAANERVASSFFPDIIDAKTQYLAGEGADVNAADESGAEIVAALNMELSRHIKRAGQAALKDAQVYGLGYAYLQVINGRLRLTKINYREVKPYYDKHERLEQVLRYYKRGECEYAEYHTAETVWEFMRDCEQSNADFELVEERPQIAQVKVYPNGDIEQIQSGKKWCRLPWFELQHNETRKSALTNAVETMIRCYDIVISDFANNLIDIQDAIVCFKGDSYTGGDIGEQMEILKNFKAIEGDAGILTAEMPYQARKEFAQIIKDNIYESLRGVDVSKIGGGQAQTATAINAAYTYIDLWADDAEWYMADWTEEIFRTAAEYKGYELPLINISFTRRAIFNEAEQMNAVAAQKGIISDLTLFEAHPLVKDAQRELERVAAQELDPAYSEGL